MSLCALLSRPIAFVPESSPERDKPSSSPAPMQSRFLPQPPKRPSNPEHTHSTSSLSCALSVATVSPTAERSAAVHSPSSLSISRPLKRSAFEAGFQCAAHPNKKQIINSASSIRAITAKQPPTRPRSPDGAARHSSGGNSAFSSTRARGYLNTSGTHCYRNASLQALGSVDEFRKLILEHTCDKDKKCVCCQLQLVFREHYNCPGTQSSAHEPSQLRTIAKSIGGTFARTALSRQEDAHEYILLLLDRLSTRGSKSSAEAIKAAINGMFTSTRITTIECLNSRCRQLSHTRNTEDTLIMLNIPALPSKRSGELSLNDCINHYTRFEHILDYKCEKCGNLGIRKKITFESPPRVALIALSRFKVGLTGVRGKDRRRVKFPELLDWEPFTQQRAGKSRLSAIVCHESSSLHSGHYYAIVRTGEHRWLKYDDGLVANVKNPLDGLENKWYLLLYTSQGD